MVGSGGDDDDGGASSEGDADFKQWTRMLVVSFALGVPTVLLHTLVTTSNAVRVWP